MNYRMLFIISLLTLVVGIGGILFMPTEDSGTTVNEAGETVAVEKKPEKLILIAELKRDIDAGRLLQVEDYVLSELTVTEDNPLVNNDLTDVLSLSNTKNLQGHLVAQNLKSGSLLSKSVVISPNDPKFLLTSLDPKQEIAFRVYLKPTESYVLDTIQSGNYVSIYNQKVATRSREDSTERYALLKLLDNVLVLQVKEFQAIDENNEVVKKDELSDEYIGYINLKVNPAQAKLFYSLEKGSQLIILPSSNQVESTNNKGLFIRKLRGNE